MSDDIESLKANSFKKETFWNSNEKKWESVEKDSFLKNNSKTILKIIKDLRNSKLKFEIHKNPTGVMGSPSDNDFYSRYFDSCSNPKTWKYPLFDLVIKHYSKDGERKFLYQDIFAFLKTGNGYRLTSLSLRSVQLK